MASIEELNLEIPNEVNKNGTETEIMLGSSPEDLLDSKKKLSKLNSMKKKKKKKTVVGESNVSSNSPPKKKGKNPQYDYSPLTKSKDKMPKRKIPPEIKKAQSDQLKVFNTFDINPNMTLGADEYNDLLQPPPPRRSLFRQLFCCESKPRLTKWFLDGDNVSISGDTYKHVKHVDLTEYEEQAIFKKLIKTYKGAPPLENLSIGVMTEYELRANLEVIMKILGSSSQFDVIKQLRISSLPDERLLWAGPQFMNSHFVMPPYNIVPRINPWVEIRHVFKKYIDKGSTKEEIVQLINGALGKFQKSVELQLLHLKFSSWTNIGDEVLRSCSNMVWKLGFSLRELTLHFCGRKITDFGVMEICDTIMGLKCKKLLALGLGFDSRNLEVTDHSLQKISEMVLSVSEKAFLRSFSLCVVSQPLTDYGLWCISQSLAKVADRLNNLVILLGSITGITDKGIQYIAEGVLKGSKNLRSISLGFLSWEVSKYGVRMLEANLCLNSLTLDMCHIYISNQGFQTKKREEYLKEALLSRHKSLKDVEVFLYLS